MKNLMAFFTLALTTSTGLAAQGPYPKDITCTVQVVDMHNTKVEEIISEKVIKPQFPEANRSGSDEAVLAKDKDFEITAELSFLRYTDLLTVKVKVKNVVVSSGLKAVVDHTDENGGDLYTTIAECTYVPGDRE